MRASKQTVRKIDSAYMKHYNAHMERQQRRRKQLIRRLVLFSFVVLLITGSMVSYHIKQRSLYAQKESEFEQLEEKLSQLNAEEKDLQEEITLLNNDEYILDLARTNYFFSKEGELIFKIIEEEPSY